jgi:hypothetical protein
MNKAEIIAELGRLSPEDRAEVQAKLDELAGSAWLDRGDLSDSDKQELDAALIAYEQSPSSSGARTRSSCFVFCTALDMSESGDRTFRSSSYP